jgi:predicted transcriptional regulator
MKKNSIATLPVVNKNKLVGTIRLIDILKAGISP